MRAIVQRQYGTEQVLQLTVAPEPTAGPNQVVVRVHAASLHPGDWMMMSGRPYIMRPILGLKRPNRKILGSDVAGVIESVGPHVTDFRPGDAVFGKAEGACAEYAAADADLLVHKPEALTFEEAASVPVSGTTALRAMRDHGKVRPGERVLINGASGGVGTFAVQIAKALGAEVTGTCSESNVEFLRAIGADHVIDYRTTDFTRHRRSYDLILDNAGSHSLRAMRRALAPSGRLIPNSGTGGGTWFGPIGRTVRGSVASWFIPKQSKPFVSVERQQDLRDLKALIDAGMVSPIVGTTVPLEKTAEAMALVGSGHSRGKTVLTV